MNIINIQIFIYKGLFLVPLKKKKKELKGEFLWEESLPSAFSNSAYNIYLLNF